MEDIRDEFGSLSESVRFSDYKTRETTSGTNNITSRTYSSLMTLATGYFRKSTLQANVNVSFSLTKKIECNNSEYINIVIDKLERLNKSRFNRVLIPKFDYFVKDDIIELSMEYIKSSYNLLTPNDSKIIYEDVVLCKSDWTFLDYHPENYIKDQNTNEIYAVDFLSYTHIPDIEYRKYVWNSIWEEYQTK